MMDIQLTSVRVKYDQMKIITEQFFSYLRKINIEEDYKRKFSALLISCKFKQQN